MDAFQVQLRSMSSSGFLRITSPHATGTLVVPKEIQLEDDGEGLWLKYRLPLGGEVRKPDGVLLDFISLADGSPSAERMLKFARKWGVLCFCEHELIASHSQECLPLSDDPNHQALQESLRQNLWPNFSIKMNIASYGGWFKDSLGFWYKYALRMRALIRIALILRGKLNESLADQWSWLRPKTLLPNGEEYSVVQEIERMANIPIYRLPMNTQCSVLGHLLREWMIEGSLSPKVEWINIETKMPASNLAAQCVLQATYKDVALFDSEHLTLFSVLIAQCMSALGPENYFRQCSCMGCEAHQEDCRELIELSLNPGRPSSYCQACRRYNRQRQKSMSRKNNKQERSKQHE